MTENPPRSAAFPNSPKSPLEEDHAERADRGPEENRELEHAELDNQELAEERPDRKPAERDDQELAAERLERDRRSAMIETSWKSAPGKNVPSTMIESLLPSALTAST